MIILPCSAKLLTHDNKKPTQNIWQYHVVIVQLYKGKVLISRKKGNENYNKFCKRENYMF